jgi:hypothetical protein
MKCVVATLFERNYHLGAAVLVNSLCKAGFKGTVYAGFRGPLPPWAEQPARRLEDGRWEMPVSPDVRIVFLRLETPAHLTNFKPDFLLQIETLAGAESEAVIYCDPDIVINVDWRYIEDWLSCGVALCEDINSPLAANHPKRVGWRRFFKPFGHELNFRSAEYANGGWIGLRWEYRKLLPIWKEFMTQITTALGGSDVVGIHGGRNLEDSYGFGDCFNRTDQDALNAVLEASPEIPVSFLGQSAMGFMGGHAIVPHALGSSKPWQRHYLLNALSGRPPTVMDKAFWHNANGPIQPFAIWLVHYKHMELILGAVLGRFIRRA